MEVLIVFSYSNCLEQAWNVSLPVLPNKFILLSRICLQRCVSDEVWCILACTLGLMRNCCSLNYSSAFIPTLLGSSLSYIFSNVKIKTRALQSNRLGFEFELCQFPAVGFGLSYFNICNSPILHLWGGENNSTWLLWSLWGWNEVMQEKWLTAPVT